MFIYLKKDILTRMTQRIRLLVCACLLMLAGTIKVHSQGITSVSGVVRDSITGETLSYVSVLFKSSTTGVMTDDNGKFSLSNNFGNTSLIISSIGYYPKEIKLREGSLTKNLEVFIRPMSFELSEVVVKPRQQKYSRKNNPAVELIQKVIDNKKENRIEAKDEYQVEIYDKLSIAFDNFRPSFEKGALKSFEFTENYVDTSKLDGKPILTVSVRETLSDFYYRKSPKSEKQFIKGKQIQGIDKSIDEGGAITSNLEEIFKSVNIFDNNINILLNRFVSPLSSTLATSYYQYFIIDTLDIGGDKCIDLAFVPVNSQSYGFSGHLYITLDDKYALKKFTLNVPTKINLNFVDQLRIEQEFKLSEDSTWVVDQENTYASFYIIPGGQQFYTHSLRSYDKYKFEIENKNSIFSQLGSLHTLADAESQRDSFWVSSRHIPLTEKEDMIGNLMNDFKAVPAFNIILKTVEILVSGYVPTAKDKNLSKFDFGPMNTVIGMNRIEGFRMRAGGMTTASLHPQIFASGYMAYGTKDRKVKYSGKLTYSFIPKRRHEGEGPVNNLSVIQEYDLYTPGQDFLHTSKDNIFVAWKVGAPVTKMHYVRKSMIQYQKEWLNGLTWTSWVNNQNSEATGSLKYIHRDEQGIFKDINDITTSEIGTQIRFAPGERAYGGRSGKESMFNVSKDAPIIKLSHQLGVKNVLGGDFSYNRTEVSAEKRIWLSSFGHVDTQLKAGKVWEKVPFPLLIMPNTNQSITIQPEAFHMMNAMEFLADQYVSLSATYYLKGWIFNRIAGLNRLKLREVVSFNGVFGSLSDKNNPSVSDNLFVFPEESKGFGNKPYMEVSFGLDNIFKILRVDYYRRLNYLDNPNIKKDGIRVSLRFSF